MSFKNIVTTPNLLGNESANRKKSAGRTAWRKRAAKSENPEERKVAQGTMTPLSNRSKS